MKGVQHTKRCIITTVHHENCNLKKVQHEVQVELGKCTAQKTFNMKRVHKRYNIKTVQHEERCDMKRVQHGKSATKNEHNTKKVLLKNSAKWKKSNTEKCNTKSARHKKVKLEKSVIWKKCNTKWVQHKEGGTWSECKMKQHEKRYNFRSVQHTVQHVKSAFWKEYL